MRPRSLVLLLLGVSVLLGGCAQVEREVTSRELAQVQGEREYQIGWESNLYQPQLATVSVACYPKTSIGRAVPKSCLTAQLLRDETDAFSRSGWLAYVLSFVAMGGLVLFSIRRIDWRPQVEPETGHLDSSAGTGSPKSAVELMRSVESEKDSQVEASAAGHDIPHTGWVGVGAGLLLLGLSSLLVGYGTGLSWGLVTGLLMFLGIGGFAVMLQIGVLPRSNMDPLIRRLFFHGGVMAGLMFGAYFGLRFPEPLLELNGVAWPF